MSGTERMACPECRTENSMLGVVDGTRQYLCRSCGMVYYTPDSCLRPAGESEQKDTGPSPKSPARPDVQPKAKPHSR